MTTEVEASVVGALIERGLTLAVAESCTAGLLGHRLTSGSGSSQYFLGGIIAYANAVKVGQLGVSAGLLEGEGAVSPMVAEQMSQGVRQRLSAHLGIGITGIAGPDGGTAEKPVGLVYIALCDETGPRVREFQFPGEREEVKWSATQAALELLHEYLLESTD
jgi:nicotinamide-nucleotide amidase